MIGSRYILQNCNFCNIFASIGGLTLLSVGSGSLRHDVAGAARSPTASHNSSKDERVILKFWVHSSSAVTSQKSLICSCFHVEGATCPLQHSSRNTFTLPFISNNDSECSSRSLPKLRITTSMLFEMTSHKRKKKGGFEA